MNKWWKNFDKRPHHICAVIKWSLLLRTPQQRLPFQWASQLTKTAHFHRHLDSYLTHDYLGPTESATHNGISIGSAVFAGHIDVNKTQEYRHTDHATCDICSNRSHLCNVRVCKCKRCTKQWTRGERILTKGRMTCRAIIKNWMIPFTAYTAHVAMRSKITPFGASMVQQKCCSLVQITRWTYRPIITSLTEDDERLCFRRRR